MLSIIGIYLAIALATLLVFTVIVAVCRTLWSTYHPNTKGGGLKVDLTPPEGLVSITPPVNKQTPYFTDIRASQDTPEIAEGSTDSDGEKGTYNPKAEP